MKQFQSLYLEPGVVILYSTTEYDHMGAFRCVDACTPLLLLFIFYSFASNFRHAYYIDFHVCICFRLSLWAPLHVCVGLSHHQALF
jgi:hypothetical protein